MRSNGHLKNNSFSDWNRYGTFKIRFKFQLGRGCQKYTKYYWSELNVGTRRTRIDDASVLLVILENVCMCVTHVLSINIALCQLLINYYVRQSKNKSTNDRHFIVNNLRATGISCSVLLLSAVVLITETVRSVLVILSICIVTSLCLLFTMTTNEYLQISIKLRYFVTEFFDLTSNKRIW